MSGDPFAEPTDSERTIIRPRPAGIGPDRPAQAAAARVPDAPAVPETGTNPLVAAAAPVLAAAIRVAEARGDGPNADRLRRAMVDAVRLFETQALATGLDSRSLRAARYALCATIDDLVLSTPWGSTSSWVQQGMTSIFHNEVIGGERFFEILTQMRQDPGHHAEVIELMYLCTALGFEGRYRVMPRGASALTELRDGVWRAVRQRRGEFERELSPRWRGAAAAARPLSRRVPPWVLALATLSIAALMFVGFTFLLAGESDAAFAELHALPPRGPIVVPRKQVAAPPPAVADVAPAADALESGLLGFLQPEIKAGLVQVLHTPQAITIRLTNRNMFGSGAASLSGTAASLLDRIGEALKTANGAVVVNGYTDSQPIRTARFPSNFELSQARADAVGAVLREHLGDPKRLRASGKGDTDPIAPNTTADGRQQNRRTEIVLLRGPLAP